MLTPASCRDHNSTVQNIAHETSPNPQINLRGFDRHYPNLQTFRQRCTQRCSRRSARRRS